MARNGRSAGPPADARTVLPAAGWIAGIVAIVAPLAIWTHRRKG